MPIHDHILSTIGHILVVRLNVLSPTGVNVFVKSESFGLSQKTY